ncbi:MAG: acyl-CoA dehydrogenase family protein [Sphingomonadaceae bacterium]
MKLDLAEDDQMLADMVDRMFGASVTSASLRAAEEVGIDRDLWDELDALGIPKLRVSADIEGGGGGTLLHAVLVAEAAGRHLAPVPLIESIVAFGLLAQLGDDGARALEHGGVATIALFDCSKQPVQIVPAGAVAATILCLDGEDVVMIAGAEADRVANHAGEALARIDFGRAKGRRVAARPAFLAAIEEYRLLTAAAVAAAARRIVDLAAEYATERVAFDRPIGSFQAIAHPLADAVTELDGAMLLARRTVEAVAAGRYNAGALIALTSGFARTAGPSAVLHAMRVFGGYGMSMEHDAQLYYRRVNGWSWLGGDPEYSFELAADRLWNRAHVVLPQTDPVELSFELSPAAEQLAERARIFSAKHLDAARQQTIFEAPTSHHPDLNRLAAEEGLYLPDWPIEHGGPGLGSEAAFAVRDVMGSHGWEDISVLVTDIVGKTIAYFGGEKLKRDVLPGFARAETYVALGYTEPSGGSDIFGAKTTAVQEGDNWLINGQKIFTSQGHIADYVLVLARTNSEKPKHKGLTLFVVPVPQPGYEVHEIKTISDERTNITYYDNVVVPDAYRIGEVDGALRILAKALEIEQSGGDFYTDGLKKTLEAAVNWARELEGGISDPRIKRVLGRLAADLEAQDVLTRRCVWAAEHGVGHKAYGPMSKLFGSEKWMEGAHALMAAAGPDLLAKGYTPAGIVEKQARKAIPATIYAGTSEIQRSIIAEAALGLPRSR